jgi:hypothetical protein
MSWDRTQLLCHGSRQLGESIAIPDDFIKQAGALRFVR